MKKVALLVTLLLSLGVHAQVYKWVDEKGQTQYGEVPPPGVTATKIGVPPPGDASAPPVAKPPAQEPQAAGQKVLSKEERATRCRFARQQLEVLEAPEVTYTNDKGETVSLDAASREKATQRVRNDITQHCS